MTKPVDFDIADAVDALSDIACQPPQGPWNWDGSTYPWRCIRDMSWINTENLNDHSPVLFVLIRLAPNGYPDAYRLRDLPMTRRTKPHCPSKHVPSWQQTGGERCASTA